MEDLIRVIMVFVTLVVMFAIFFFTTRWAESRKWKRFHVQGEIDNTPGQPPLPRVPKSLTTPYRFSGKCPPQTLISILIVGVIGITIGLLISIILTLIGALLAGKLGPSLGNSQAAGLVYLLLVETPLYLVSSYVGAFVGELIAKRANDGKCRSKLFPPTVGILGGITVLALGAILLPEVIQLELIRSQFQNINLPGVMGVAALSSLMFIFYMYSYITTHVAPGPFCEASNTWYEPIISKNIDISLAKPFIDTMSLKSLHTPKVMSVSNDLPNLQIQLWCCSDCSSSDFVIKVYQQWGEVKKIRTKLWFASVLPSELGTELQQALSAG